MIFLQCSAFSGLTVFCKFWELAEQPTWLRATLNLCSNPATKKSQYIGQVSVAWVTR